MKYSLSFKALSGRYWLWLFLVFAFSISNGPVSGADGCIEATGERSVSIMEEGDEPDSREITALKKKTRLLAWDKFVSQLEPNVLKAYTVEKQKVLSELDFYVEEKFTFKFDESAEKIFGRNCITVNTDRLKAALKVSDEPEKPEAIASGEGSLFVTLFVARQALSELTFDAQRTVSASSKAQTSTTNKAKKKTSAAAKESASASGGTAVSIAKTKTSQKSKSKSEVAASSSATSKGSTLRKSNEIVYKIISAAAADGALSEPLINAGYEAAVYEDVASECEGVSTEAISETFATKESMGKKQRRSAFRAARECEATYFALGTMTADLARTHRSGRKMVTVRVQGTVFNITKRVPRRVADIPPAQYIGIGVNEDSARTNALTLAGKKAGETITKVMQEKGLR